MNDNEPAAQHSDQRSWGMGHWIVVIATGLLALAYITAGNGYIGRKSPQFKGASNARQIVGLMLTFASDNSGMYPDSLPQPGAVTANQAFRHLCQEGFVKDETLFGCPQSSLLPDKNIGHGPGYAQFLMPGENHWMLLSGMSNMDPSLHPLVFENATSTVWPPQWLRFSPPGLTLNPLRPRGAAWGDEKVIVALNDGSVEMVKLVPKGSLLELPVIFFKLKGRSLSRATTVLDIE